MKKVYKKVEQENGTITFYGGRTCRLHFAYNSDTGEEDQYFIHYGIKYWLSEFMVCGSFGGFIPKYMKEFDGYMSDSFFSGVAVKLGKDQESVMVCTFIG